MWGQSENFFNAAAGVTKEESGLADAYYRLFGGGVGGPIVKNRTFFWTALEGYRSGTTRGQQEIWPTANQRNGDFSRTFTNGAPTVLYNPWCRGGVANARCPATGTGSIATGGLFTGAIVPLTHPAVSQTGLNILKTWPTETINGPMAQNEDGNTNANGTAFVVDQAMMWTFKGEHKFTDKSSLSGLYIYNKTDEPGSTIMKADKLFMADQDQWFGPLRRRPHVLTLNSTNVLNNTTVLSLRYGFSTWQDSCDAQPFSAGLQSLGFSPTYVNALGPGGKETFPSLQFDNTEDVGGWGPGPVRWKGPYAINGALTKLMGSHSFKVGGDARRLGVALATETELGGRFAFDNLFTSRNGAGGNEVASLLLGLPTTGRAPHDPAEFEWFAKYWGAYFQDDWRVSSRFTLNYGLRLEHEDGLREINNRQTVAFDQNAVNPIDALVPKAGTLLAGKTLKGGLVYAGVNGAPEQQGNPKAIKPAPRVGATFARRREDRRSRRLWAVLGAVELQHERARPDRILAGRRSSASRRRRARCRSARWTTRSRLACCRQSVARKDWRPTSAARSTSSTRTRATRRSISTRSTSSASSPARWPSASATSAPPGAISASAAPMMGPPATSTSTRSIPHWPGKCFRWAAAGMRRSCGSRFRTRSSASPARANSPRDRRSRAASC